VGALLEFLIRPAQSAKQTCKPIEFATSRSDVAQHGLYLEFLQIIHDNRESMRQDISAKDAESIVHIPASDVILIIAKLL